MRGVGTSLIVSGISFIVIGACFHVAEEDRDARHERQYQRYLERHAQWSVGGKLGLPPKLPVKWAWGSGAQILIYVCNYSGLMFLIGCLLFAAGSLRGAIRRHEVTMAAWMQSLFRRLPEPPRPRPERPTVPPQVKNTVAPPVAEPPKAVQAASVPTAKPSLSAKVQAAPSEAIPLTWIPDTPGGILGLAVWLIVCGVATYQCRGQQIDVAISVAVWYFLVIVVRYFTVVAPAKKARRRQ